MKSSNRKSRGCKTQTLVGMFLSTWIPIAILAAILLIVGIMLFFMYQGSEHLSQFYMQVDDGNLYDYSTFQEIYDDSVSNATPSFTTTEQQYWVRNQIRLCCDGEAGYATVVYQKTSDGYQVLMDSEERAFIAIEEKTYANHYIFTCDSKLFSEEAWNYVDSIDEEDNPEEYYRIVLHTIYVSGDSFLPGDYDVEKVNYSDPEYKGTLIASYSSNPNVSDGYTLINLDEDSWSVRMTPLRVGTKENDATRAYIDEMGHEVIGMSACIYEDGYLDVTRKVLMNYPISMDGAGKLEGCIVSAYQYNLWEENKALLLVVTLLTILVSIGLAALITNNHYRSYRFQLQLAQYRKNMTNALAHDLKSPLMVISGYAENLKENVHVEKREYYAESIMSTASYMNLLISNLFALNELEDAKYKLKRETFQLEAMCEDILKNWEELIKERELHCSIEGSATVCMDAFLMRRALDNLIGNAAKYTTEQGRIAITITKDSLRIVNTGSMPQELLDKAFMPFVKGDAVRSNESGSGLGLAIVKSIMELHQMDYHMQNTEDGIEFLMKF